MELITAQGMRMPKLGLGTWPMKGEDCTSGVQSALELGYRHIDTAAMYGNEEAVGAALAKTTVPRAEIHVTTKVWHDQLAPEAMRRSLEDSLRKLQLDYVDLFLIHWPSPDMDLPRAIEGLVALRDAGKARAIGVSNFPVALMEQALQTGAPLACNQVEYHPMLDQSAVIDFTRAHDMGVTAYAPIARNKVSEIPELKRVAEKHNATPVQITLKWLIDQPNVSAVPKAAGAERQKANLDCLAIKLDDEDRALIAKIPKDGRTISPAWAPTWDAVKQ